MDDEFDSELVCSEMSDAQAISVGVGVGKEFVRDVVNAADIMLVFMPNSVRLDGHRPEFLPRLMAGRIYISRIWQSETLFHQESAPRSHLRPKAGAELKLELPC